MRNARKQRESKRWNARLLARLNATVEANKKLREALIWCGGASDFAPGGQAEEGWKRYALPIINETSDSGLIETGPA